MKTVSINTCPHPPQHILRFKNIETFGPTPVQRSNPPHSNWVHPVLQPQLCPHSSAMDWCAHNLKNNLRNYATCIV
jgi:hypothetical protein